MLVGVVAVIITVVVIRLLDVSSLGTLGTAQTLAHNTAVLPGRQNSEQAPGMPASFWAGRGSHRVLLSS